MGLGSADDFEDDELGDAIMKDIQPQLKQQQKRDSRRAASQTTGDQMLSQFKSCKQINHFNWGYKLLC
jgi:hypothetical protein